MSAVALRVCGAALTFIALSCGGAAKDFDVGATPRPPVRLSDWPQSVDSAGDALTVEAALRSVDNTQLRVRGYLVAITAPCPSCNIGTNRGEAPPKDEGRIGKTARPRGPDLPGCTPCPPAAATFSDQSPGGPASAPLRTVGASEGLQSRHVGHMFVITGTFHARGEAGPELDVSDVRAIAGP